MTATRTTLDTLRADVTAAFEAGSFVGTAADAAARAWSELSCDGARATRILVTARGLELELPVQWRQIVIAAAK